MGCVKGENVLQRIVVETQQVIGMPSRCFCIEVLSTRATRKERAPAWDGWGDVVYSVKVQTCAYTPCSGHRSASQGNHCVSKEVWALLPPLLHVCNGVQQKLCSLSLEMWHCLGFLRSVCNTWERLCLWPCREFLFWLKFKCIKVIFHYLTLLVQCTIVSGHLAYSLFWMPANCSCWVTARGRNPQKRGGWKAVSLSPRTMAVVGF